MKTFKRIIGIYLSVASVIAIACSDNSVVPSDSTCTGEKFLLSKGDADWEWHKIGGVETITDLAFNGEIYLAIGMTERRKTSFEGSNWITSTYGSNGSYRAMAVHRGKFISVGEGPYAQIDIYGAGWSSFEYETGQQHTLRGISIGDQFALAVGDNGEMLKSDDGTSWERIPRITNVNLNDVYLAGQWHTVVGDSGSVLRTKNGTYWIDWSPGVPDNFRGMAVGGNTRVFVTDLGAVFTTDYYRNHWSRYDVSPGRCLRSVVWSDDRFVIVGDGGFIATSPDGYCWDTFESGLEADLLNIINTDKLVVVGTQGTILNSTDGARWELRPPGGLVILKDVIWTEQKFIAVGNYGEIHTSSNANDWKKATIHGDQSVDVNSVARYGDKYYAVCDYGRVLESNDGEDWSDIDIGVGFNINLWSIAEGGGRLLIGGDEGAIVTTLNGVDWEIITVDDPRAIFGIAASDSLIVAVSTIGRVHTSIDGHNWPGWKYLTVRLNDITWTGEIFVAIGHRDVFTSPDGFTWEQETLGDGFDLRAIAGDSKKLVAVGSHGTIFTRTDLEWVAEVSGLSTTIWFNLNGVTASSDGFVIVGDRGIILTQ